MSGTVSIYITIVEHEWDSESELPELGRAPHVRSKRITKGKTHRMLVEGTTTVWNAIKGSPELMTLLDKGDNKHREFGQVRQRFKLPGLNTSIFSLHPAIE